MIEVNHIFQGGFGLRTLFTSQNAFSNHGVPPVKRALQTTSKTRQAGTPVAKIERLSPVSRWNLTAGQVFRTCVEQPARRSGSTFMREVTGGSGPGRQPKNMRVARRISKTSRLGLVSMPLRNFRTASMKIPPRRRQARFFKSDSLCR